MSSWKIAAIVVSASVLAGCASPARVDQMAAGATTVQTTKMPDALKTNIAIRDVTGGKETNPMWVSNVGSSEFERALETSLRNVGVLASNRQTGAYQLTAHLEKLDQPLMGFSMTVTASVRYVVYERASGKTVFERTLVTPYTAGATDAFIGAERLKLANEGAIRNNITQLIDHLQRLDVTSVSLR